MGLQFRVGPVGFTSPFREHVEAALLTEFNYVAPGHDVESEDSDELGWSGWESLQQAASETLGVGNAPHLLSMEAWLGVYLPISIEPCTFQVGNPATEFACASLPALYDELTRFAAARTLPVSEEALNKLWDNLMDRIDDGEIDEADEADIQTYSQLMLSAKCAVGRNLPLWVVK